MAKNENADVENKIIGNRKRKAPLDLSSELLKEEEKLKQFAKLIIDIYFDQQYENEKNKQYPASSA